MKLLFANVHHQNKSMGSIESLPTITQAKKYNNTIFISSICLSFKNILNFFNGVKDRIILYKRNSLIMNKRNNSVAVITQQKFI
jgi:hypothetical protein